MNPNAPSIKTMYRMDLISIILSMNRITLNIIGFFSSVYTCLLLSARKYREHNIRQRIDITYKIYISKIKKIQTSLRIFFDSSFLKMRELLSFKEEDLPYPYIPSLKLLLKYFFEISLRKTMRNKTPHTTLIPIPLHSTPPREIPCLTNEKVLNYGDGNMKVMTQTLLGFYRNNNLEGTRIEQSTDSFHMSHQPLRF